MKTFHKILGLTFTALLFLAFVSCGGKKMTIDEIKVFPNAAEGVKFPELNTRISTSENLVSLDIQDKLGKFNTKTFTLNEGTKFESVQNFYNEEMKSKNFLPVSDKPVKSSDSQILYYEKKVLFSGEKTAIVFTEIENYETKKIYPFLTIFVSQ